MGLYLLVFAAMSHWSVPGLLILLYSSYWAPTGTGTPLGYPIVALCHGDPVALDLQVQSLHTLQQFIDEVDVWVG